MYFNSFQSGRSIELFNPNNKDQISNWKFTGKHYKTYDNLLRCSMYVLGSGGLSKMQIPKKPKDNLGIIQSFIVFQLYLFSPKQFSIEIAISDTKKIKHRLIFSTHLRDKTSHHFSSLIPILDLPLGVWVNLSIDVLSFVCDCFKFLTFKSIDGICLSANCKVRKIFTMRNRLISESDYESIIQRAEGEVNESHTCNDNDMEKIPLSLDMPSRANARSINLNVNKVNDQLKLIQLKKEADCLLTHVQTASDHKSLIHYNNNHSFDNRDNSKKLSPVKYNKKNNYKHQLKVYYNIETIDKYSNDNKKDNYFSIKKPKSTKKNNKKQKGNMFITEKYPNADNSINNLHRDRDSNRNHYSNLLIKIQYPQQPNSNKSEERYQDQYGSCGGDLIDNSSMIQLQSSLDRKKIAQLNNFLYNSKIELQKQNTMESNHIEEINIYESQLSLNKRESGIIKIDDITNNEYIKRQQDITQQAIDLFKNHNIEKENKKKILNEMLNDYSLDTLMSKEIDRPYSPPLNNSIKIKDDNSNTINVNCFQIADSITFGGKI